MSNTSVLQQETNRVGNGLRIALGASGLVAVILGVLILIAPMKTASFITAIVALYAVVSGIVYASIGFFSKKPGTWKRIGHAALGVLFFAVGVIAFANLGSSTAVLATIVAIAVGVVWIVEGVISLTTLKDTANRAWVASYAAVSILAGILVLFAPFAFAAMMWLVLGISLVILGIVQIVRAVTLKEGKLIIGA